MLCFKNIFKTFCLFMRYDYHNIGCVIVIYARIRGGSAQNDNDDDE